MREQKKALHNFDQGDVVIRKDLRRVLLKLSGQAMAGNKGLGISIEQMIKFSKEIKSFINRTKSEVAIVIGGGNFYRGDELVLAGMRRVSSDHIGMLGTMMNAIALAEVLDSQNQKSIIFSPQPIMGMSLPLNYDQIEQSFNDRKVVIFAGGLAQPCFSTDSCASVRAIEIGAQYLIKATDVDGVFDLDPKKYKDAKLYQTITYQIALEKQLEVMDLTAFTQCQKADITLFVCNIYQRGVFESLYSQEPHGTIVTNSTPN